MVDYTKPAMRDETWRRWKGGKKLADELRTFYTAKHVFERQAALNPALPGKPAANGEYLSARLKRRLMSGHDNPVRRNMLRRQLRGLMRQATGSAPANLPGRYGPKR